MSEQKLYVPESIYDFLNENKNWILENEDVIKLGLVLNAIQRAEDMPDPFVDDENKPMDLKYTTRYSGYEIGYAILLYKQLQEHPSSIDMMNKRIDDFRNDVSDKMKGA